MRTLQRLFGLGVLLGVLALPAVASPAAAVDPPTGSGTNGFSLVPEITGLTRPTAARFTKDGKVFVAEQAGVVKVFDGLDDLVPDVLIDLRPAVHYKADRGLMGLEVHPDWPAVPWVWLLYAANSHPSRAPWPSHATDPNGEDRCSFSAAAAADECVATGALVRLVVDPATNRVVSRNDVITGEWCSPFPVHSVGTVLYGSDGALYVGAGDGASWGGNIVPDYGQMETSQANVCDDPVTKVNGVVDPVTSEGGSLRAQDLRTPNDRLGFNGSIIRVHPVTGAALPFNPLAGGSDAADDRHVAYGLRNPFRFAQRPGTGELWVGDAGWNSFEEINVLPMPVGLRTFSKQPLRKNPGIAGVPNFGWPCYEGSAPTPAWRDQGNRLCTSLANSASGRTDPAYSYPRGRAPLCTPTAWSTVSAVQFYRGGAYPDGYDGALFVADVGAGCIWAMPVNGRQPDAGRAKLIASQLDEFFPVDIQPGPGGDLFAVDVQFGTISRIHYGASNVGCPENDTLEPNDTLAEARAVASGDSVDAVICPNDRDNYAFHALEGTPLDLAVTYSPSGYRLDLDLYAGTELIASTAGSVSDAQLHLSAPKTTVYTLQVRGAGPQSRSSYQMTSSAPCPDDGLANGEPVNAAHTPLPAWEMSTRCPGETDWYTFDALAGERRLVQAGNSILAPYTHTGPIQVRTYDSALNFIPPSVPRRLEDTNEFATRTTGRFYAAVTSERREILARYAMHTGPLRASFWCSTVGLGDAWEPNNNAQNEAADSPDWPRAGYLCDADTDWHVVTAEPGETMTVSLRGRDFSGFAPSESDMSTVDLQMIDAAGNTVAVGTGDAGTKTLEHQTSVGGTFSIRVRDLANGIRGYVLDLDRAEMCTPELSEPNDDQFHAVRTVSGDVVAGSLCGDTDEDWYAIAVPPHATVTGTITFPPDGRDVNVGLRAGAGPTQGWAVPGAQGQSYTALDQPELVYVRVAGDEAAYLLEVEITCVDAGGGPAQPEAVQLAEFQAVGGVVCPGSEDWFAIDLAPGHPQTFVILRHQEHIGPLDIQLVLPDGTVVPSQTEPTGERVILHPSDQAGRHYYRVFAPSGDANSFEVEVRSRSTPNPTD